MTVSATSDVYYDPYNVELNADPYAMFRRLRGEAPLYYNHQHDFYALSRFADVDGALVDHETFSSARGAILELIESNIEMPPGVLIFEDPPTHDIHRSCSPGCSRRERSAHWKARSATCVLAASIRWSARNGSASWPTWGPNADAGDRHAVGDPRN